MATNKRKDSAALFELIDKSTLKVPKNASGSLKIPSWWSTKGNPAAKSNATPALADTDKSTPSAASTTAVPGSTSAPTTPRHPLIPVKAPVYAPPPGTVSRANHASYVPGTRIPIWAAVIGGLAAAIIVGGAIWVAIHPQSQSTGPTTTDSMVDPGNYTPQGIIPDHPDSDYTAAHGQGHVYGSQSNRDPQLFYLVIAHYPKEDVARHAATLLAAHGVDVCIESSRGYYWLISFNGYPAMADPDAQAFQRKVIEIKDGKTKGVFNSAYFSHVVSGTSG
jgi:hypothetical protein